MSRPDNTRGRRRHQTASATPANRRRSSYDEARGHRRPVNHRSLPMLLVVLLLVVAARLVWLQIIEGPDLAAKAASVYTSSVPLTAKRGTIYDRNGNVLAVSVESRTLYCNPEVIDGSNKDDAAATLAEHLGGDAADYLDLLDQDTTFVYIKRQVDIDVATKTLDDLSSRDINGVYSLADTKRVYPYEATAGQVLGFVGTDGHGLSGLELQYDDALSGTDGEMMMEQGRDGTPVAGGASSITEARDGTDIIISVDVNIQQKVEEQLTQALSDTKSPSGNVVVSDPTSGEILAIASSPLYDPTNSATLSSDSLKLASVSDSYEPGSTLKVLTLAIGYDTGTISEASTFSVPAKVKVGDNLVGDDDGRSSTMNMTPYEILRRSSNAGAALIGQDIGADKFAAGIARFGIGSPTGIDFPGEATGIVTKLEDYDGSTLGSEAYGQGIAFPSIQLVRAVGAVANKGVLTTPHFLIQKGSEEVSWAAGGQACSQEAAASVTHDMVGVVEEGTGKKAHVDGYVVAGKTGTGEQASSEGGYAEGLLLSSFIGFANADDAEVLVYVGMYGTEQYGATAAAPYFSAIMSEALADLDVTGE